MPRALAHISYRRAFTSIAALPRFYLLLYATPHCLVGKVVVSHNVDYKYYVAAVRVNEKKGWMINVTCVSMLFGITLPRKISSIFFF